MSKRERSILIAGVLVLFAVLLVIGGVLYYQSIVQPANRAVYDTVMTRASGAGQTAVFEGQLTRQAGS